MGKEYILQQSINNWLVNYNLYERRITKKILAWILGIDVHLIVSLNVRSRCINVLTENCFYKIQIYGDSIKRDLNNRKLYLIYKQLIPPIKIYRKIPFTVMMPRLKKSTKKEEMAYYILEKLRETAHKTLFKIDDYPLIINGLNVLEKCDGGGQVSRKLREYLKKQEEVILYVGIVHGDFHSDNIMCLGNMPVIIDIDCSRENDIQAVDALYYIIEEVKREHGDRKNWLDEWLLVYNNINIVYGYRCIQQVDIDIKLGLIILLLERISQDKQDDSYFIETNKESIKKIIRKLKIEQF